MPGRWGIKAGKLMTVSEKKPLRALYANVSPSFKKFNPVYESILWREKG